jgi:hypothetical protein
MPLRHPPMSRRTRAIAMAFLPGILLAGVLLALSSPFPQPLGYHDFADQRALLGIPHAGDVLSNLALLLAGAWGLVRLAQPQLRQTAFIDRREPALFGWFFAGVCLTALGSAWYHWQPDNYSLVWDRLPMTLSFMSLFTILIVERVQPSLGYALFRPLVWLGMASVLYWIWTESRGAGDLRWYLLVQFYPLLSIALMLMLLPARYTLGNHYWGLLLCYVAAKVVEHYDQEIFDLTAHTLSGHNLKHLFAAAGIAWLLHMLRLRRPVPAGENAAVSG